MRKPYLFAAAAAITLSVLGGYWSFERKQTAREQATLLALLEGATKALAADLAPEQDAASQSRALSAAAQRIDQDAAMLRNTPSDRVADLSADSAQYLDTARELLKRRATLLALHPRVRSGMAQFREHMLNGRGATAWISEAVRLKNRLEEDYRDYRGTIETHTRLSDVYAEDYRRLAQRVPTQLLAGLEDVALAQERVAALGEAADKEMEALRRMMSPRP